MSYAESLRVNIESAKKCHQSPAGYRRIAQMEKQLAEMEAQAAKADKLRVAVEGSRQSGVVEGHDANNPGVARVRDQQAHREVVSPLKLKQQEEQKRLAAERQQRLEAERQAAEARATETKADRERREAEEIEKQLNITACARVMADMNASEKEYAQVGAWLHSNGYCEHGPCYDSNLWITALHQVRSQLHHLRSLIAEAQTLDGGNNV